MSVVRARQPGITRVLPHAGNKRYAISRTRVTTGSSGLAFGYTDGDSQTRDTYATTPWTQTMRLTTDYTNTNRGNDAEQFPDVEARIPTALAAEEVSVLYCHCGTNDITAGVQTGSGYTPAMLAFMTDRVESLANACIANGLRLVLSDVTGFSGNAIWGLDPDYPDLLDGYNEWFDQQDETLFTKVYLNRLMCTGDPHTLDLAYDSGDGLHWNNTGHALVFGEYLKAAQSRQYAGL